MTEADIAFELAEIANELYAREASANSIDEKYHDTPYVDLCDRIVALAQRLKCQGCYTIAMEGPNEFQRVYYEPTCRYGCIDCIGDPAYIQATYPDWYARLVAQGALFCETCIDGSEYDDEDK